LFTINRINFVMKINYKNTLCSPVDLQKSCCHLKIKITTTFVFKCLCKIVNLCHFIVIASLLVLCICNSSAAADQVRFVKSIDGDSLVVEVEGLQAEVRLIGIDCPEHGQEWGAEAKAFAERFASAGPLTLTFDKERRDRYHRALAYVWRGQTMLNEELARNGLAVEYCQKKNRKYCERFKQAEEEAKVARRGFWAQGGLKQTPAEYRREHRGERAESKTSLRSSTMRFLRKIGRLF